MELLVYPIAPSWPGLLIATTLVTIAFAIGENVYPRCERTSAFLASLQLAVPVLSFDWILRTLNEGVSPAEWVLNVVLAIPPVIAVVTPLALQRVWRLAFWCGVISFALWGYSLFVLAFAGRG